MKQKMFTPKLLTLLLAGISKEQLAKDLMAGLIVGIVALPLAIAFAIASGVSPEKGLITAVVAGLTISLLGGSRVQIGGPTGAFIVIVYGIVQEHGINGLVVATFLAGFIIMAFGFLRLGSYLKFVPYPLIVGFTSGIAVIIFSSQIKDFFGLAVTDVPADFIGKWTLYASHWQSVNGFALLIAAMTVVMILGMGKITGKVPGSIVAIIVSTAAAYYLQLPVETIESQFGEIPTGLSLPSVPDINLAMLQDLLPAALAIALLGSIESLLSAMVADGMMGGRHRSNMELVAQGAANIFSGLFGGIPATGAIARTATNIKNGGRTPIAGVVHALVLLLIMLLFSSVAKLIPLSCLAGILVVVAWHMGEWHQFLGLLKSHYLDVVILLTTFFLTVFFDLILAIEVGMVLSSFIFMKQMSETVQIENRRLQRQNPTQAHDVEMLFDEELPDFSEEIALYEIDGPLFFGASQKFQEVLSGGFLHIPKILILRMRDVPFVDSTGMNTLRVIYQQMQARGTTLIISGANAEVQRSLNKAGIVTLIGAEAFHADIHSALAYAESLLPKQAKNEQILNVT